MKRGFNSNSCLFYVLIYKAILPYLNFGILSYLNLERPDYLRSNYFAHDMVNRGHYTVAKKYEFHV